jgi:hypothetical protein
VQEGSEEGQVEEDFSPHKGRINTLTIDERTRYLLSGDSAGDILVWRLDSKGWYELLRKFKRDSPSQPVGTILNKSTIGRTGTMGNSGTHATSTNDDHIVQEKGGIGPTGASGIMSLVMHPDKYKTQMLSLSLEPGALKVYNTSTYKVP